jgi:hypothetical protein
MWLGTALPGRSCEGTYCLIAPEELPPIGAAELDGELGWLPEPRGDVKWAIGASDVDRVFEPAEVERLGEACAEAGIELPRAMQRFLGTSRRNWIRSPTGCWLELPQRLVRIAGTDAYVVRFLNDQQGVFFWYVVLDERGERGTFVSNELLDHDDPWLEIGQPAEAYRCAGSFEEFLYRYWLESEIFFRTDEGAPLTPEMDRYLRHLAHPRADV